MNRTEQRLEKLERHAEKYQDLSGRRALTEELRVYLREMSTIPEAVAIAREQANLKVRGVAVDSPEMLDTYRRMRLLWDAHVAENPHLPKVRP